MAKPILGQPVPQKTKEPLTGTRGRVSPTSTTRTQLTTRREEGTTSGPQIFFRPRSVFQKQVQKLNRPSGLRMKPFDFGTLEWTRTTNKGKHTQAKRNKER